MQAISLTDLEIDVVLGFSTLKLDVLRNDLIGHNAGRRYEEPPCPKVPTPERLAQCPEVSHQPIGGLALDGLHHFARGQIRRHRQQEVNMVRSNVSLQNVDIVCPADLSDQITYLHRNVTPQNRLAVLGMNTKW